ncbi:hypothetical protein [Kutzneria buriramensis]|uniref:Tachylectin n=1 Tax=Kutzneria buriramensis TaxID=1045776 RepID=A0A3E0I6P5_9PSEU|nr:hypothetical protein [Kutzneria buriramensis]REH54290.1 hypothetical protein BCF44_102522 [Kutzneria buriramensis]
MLSRKAKALAAAVVLAAASLTAPAAHAGAGYFTTLDLTAQAGAPTAGPSQSVGWSTPWDLQRHIAYRAADGRLIVASSAAGSSDWTWTTAVGPADIYYGYLSAFTYSWDQTSRIVYVNGNTHHLIETWNSPSSPTWQTVDLTAAHNGPAIQTDPHGYEQNGQMHIVFLDGSGDGTIWEAVFKPGPGWRFINLTTLTGIRSRPNNGESLTAASLGADGEAIGYVGTDGYPHVLRGLNGVWTDQRVGVPAVTSFLNLNSMVFLRDNHLVRYTLRYEAPDIDMHLATLTAGTWTDTDVFKVLPQSTGYEAVAKDDSYAFDADGSEHMFTIAGNAGVHEYVRTLDGRWYFWADTGPIVNAPGEVSGFAAPDDNVHGTETEFYVYQSPDRHQMVADLTAPYQP